MGEEGGAGCLTRRLVLMAGYDEEEEGEREDYAGSFFSKVFTRKLVHLGSLQTPGLDCCHMAAIS